MSTLTAILEPDADGTLHLPLPAELRTGNVKIKVTAILEVAKEEAKRKLPAPKPDFTAIRQQLWGPDQEKRRLSPEDSAFIRDRGDW